MNSYIVDLDASLIENGQEIILRRTFGTTSQTDVDVTVQANVRAVSQPDMLISGITQDDVKVIMSMTQIIAEGWPGQGDEDDAPFFVDRRVPRKGDTLIINGQMYRAEMVNQIKIGTEVVRIEITTKGGAAA